MVFFNIVRKEFKKKNTQHKNNWLNKKHKLLDFIKKIIFKEFNNSV